jgi:polysaccharide export outer membrane protein
MKMKKVLFLLLPFFAGCAFAPGMNMDEGRYETASVDPWDEKAAEVKITPINASLLSKIREQSSRQPAGDNQAVTQPYGNYQYRVGPQDVLTVTVWDHPELTIPAGEFRPPEAAGHLVAADGNMFFPYVGLVKVLGRTLEDIRIELTRRLAKYVENPQLDVRVAAFRSQKVLVVGEVKQPGVLPITDVPLTALEAINRVGGIALEADLQNVIVTRQGEIRKLDLQSLYDAGDLSQNLLLQDGDVVHVPDRNRNRIYVLGEVVKPATYPMNKGRMNLAEAIGLSEGFDRLSSDPSQVYVIRGELNQPNVYRLDASSPDALLLATQFPLQPQDVVFVSSTNLVRWNRVMSQILPTIQGLWQTDVLINR